MSCLFDLSFLIFLMHVPAKAQQVTGFVQFRAVGTPDSDLIDEVNTITGFSSPLLCKKRPAIPRSVLVNSSAESKNLPGQMRAGFFSAQCAGVHWG